VLSQALEESLQRGPGEWVPLEAFATLPHCLEWRLARQYWQQQGPAAFFTGDVPYASINDGRLSADAARLLAEIHAGARPESIRVLEVGGGCGVFAKLFLDELRILAPELYAVTTYVWTDATPEMVRRAQVDGVFAAHEERVRLHELDLPEMASLGLHADAEADAEAEADAGFDLVVANYILDNLPATLLRVSPNGVEELEVRATLPAKLDPALLGGLSAQDWVERISQSDASQAQLVPLYPWFSLECRYRPVSRADFAFGQLITEGTADGVTHWHHHEAAWQWLGKLLPQLRPKGGVLVNDYGHFPLQHQTPPTAMQHFGGSLANGLNFDELAAWPLCAPDWQVVAPATDGRHLISRWVGRCAQPLAASLFQLIFDGARRERVPELLEQARDHAARNRTEEARWYFWEAYQRSPRCWHVLEVWATFYLGKLKDAATACALAEAGLRLHPRHPPLLNIRGDALYELKRYAEAEQCYLQAVALNPRDIRARLNLSYVHLKTGRLAQALSVVAEALALDTQADYRDALIEQQRQALQQLSTQTQAALKQQLNRFRNLDSNA
jgi:tetratricopeptide (TPR) repeat protein